MAFLMVLLAVCAPSIAGLSAGSGISVIPGPIPARIVRVIDGDTIVVSARIWLGQKVETKVRLDGIDTPELKGKCTSESVLGATARNFVIALGDGRDGVNLHGIKYGKFAGRVVARVESATGVDYATALIDAGLARPYDGGRRLPWC